MTLHPRKKRIAGVCKILDRKHNGDDNAAMMAGRVVQAICDMVLIDNMDISQATAAGMEKLWHTNRTPG